MSSSSAVLFRAAHCFLSDHEHGSKLTGHAWTGCRIYNHKMHPPQGMKRLVLARFSASPSQPASDDARGQTAATAVFGQCQLALSVKRYW